MKGYLKPLVILLLIVLFAGSMVVFLKAREASRTASGELSLDEMKQVLGTQVELPAEEKPTVVSIVDSSKLRNQNPEFYSEVQDGDVLFIYTSKAAIFRPQTGKLVMVFPLMGLSQFSPEQQ